MSKDKSNPGVVNTNKVLDTAKGVTSSRKGDGTIHTTAYDKESNRRVSWNENKDGTITDVHSTKQNDNSHNTYKRGK